MRKHKIKQFLIFLTIPIWCVPWLIWRICLDVWDDIGNWLYD